MTHDAEQLPAWPTWQRRPFPDANLLLAPVVGELTVVFETLTLASAPDVRIVTYLTDPGTPSADALDLLRSWVATTTAVSTPQVSSGPSVPSNNTPAAD